MKKAYYLVPIIGVLIFAGIYWNFRSHNAEVERQRAEQAAKIKEEKRQKEIAERKKAYEDAIALQEKRKQEREEREARQKAADDARQALIDARDVAFRDQDRQSKQVARLKDDIRIEKEAVAKVQEKIRLQLDEIKAQETHVKQAQENEKSFEMVITKIDAAEKAAEQLRAAEAKKNS